MLDRAKILTETVDRHRKNVIRYEEKDMAKESQTKNIEVAWRKGIRGMGGKLPKADRVLEKSKLIHQLDLNVMWYQVAG